MRRPTYFLLLSLCALGCAEQTRVKVFVLAGQSNMEGQAEVEEQWPNGTEKNGTLLYQVTDPRTSAEFAQTRDPANRSAWRVRDDVFVWFNEDGKTDDGTWGNLSTRFGCEGAAANHIGPEFGFGYKMADALGEQILIIKTAWGGKTLAGDFRPPSSCADPATSRNRTVGFYYTRMLQMVAQTLSPANLTRYFPGAAAYDGFDIVGFGWDQGWNDGCGQTDTDEYEFNMVNLIHDLRLAWNNPTLAVSIPVSGFGGWGQKVGRRLEIIAAQFAAANATKHPELHGHVQAEETRDFWRDPHFSPSAQAYHWGHNAESYWLIGQAMGSGMLQAMA